MYKNLAIKIIFGILFVVTIVTAGYFSMVKKSFLAPQSSPTPKSFSAEYLNATYGFSIALPISWQGYSVTIDKWAGYTIGGQGDVPFTDGPLLSVHNPKWTGANTYQDIPIMVFTLDQWNLLQQEKFHIGAAPIKPNELGRNSRYVFALPARYNFAFLPGYQEVDQIIQSKPLKTF